MTKKMPKLKAIINEYSSITEEKRKFIQKCLKKDISVELNNLINMAPEEIDIFKQLRSTVIDEIAKDPTEKKIIRKLTLAGLDQQFASILFGHCNRNAKLFLDAQLIKAIDLYSFEKAVDFTVNKISIYQDYLHYFVDYLVEYTNLNDSKQALDITKFLYHHILEVSSRVTSPELLKLKLEYEYDLPPEYSQILYTYIVENIVELQQAFLLSQINDAVDRVTKFNNFIDKLEVDTHSE